MGYNNFIKKIPENTIPFLLSFFLIFSVFNTPFLIKFILFFTLILVLIIKKNIFKFIFLDFFKYRHFLFFLIYCVVSFFLINDNQIFEYNPNILNIIFFSLMSILIINYRNFYFEIMKYVSFMLLPILIISLFYHYFILESKFLSATLFFYDFKDETFATKNTLAIFLCLIMPYLIHRLSLNVSFINVITFTIFFLSLFYTFSRSGLFIYLIILLGCLFSFKKKLMITSLVIIFASIVLAVIFQITPNNYNKLKSLANAQSVNKTYSISRVEKTFSSNSHRAQYIFSALEGFKNRPIFGHGLTKFYQNNFEYVNNKLIRKPITHNDYVQILYEMGLVGVALFFHLLFIIFYQLILQTKKTQINYVQIIQFLALLMSLNFINLIDHALFWVSLSIFANYKNIEKKNL